MPRRAAVVIRSTFVGFAFGTIFGLIAFCLASFIMGASLLKWNYASGELPIALGSFFACSLTGALIGLRLGTKSADV